MSQPVRFAASAPSWLEEEEQPVFRFGVQPSASTDAQSSSDVPAAFTGSAASVRRPGQRGRRRTFAPGPVASAGSSSTAGFASENATSSNNDAAFATGVTFEPTPQSTASPSAPSDCARRSQEFITECNLREVNSLADKQKFFEAVQACIPMLMGSDRTAGTLRSVCESWQAYQQERFGQHQDELNSVTAQLMAAKDRAESLKHAKADKDWEFRREKERREEIERQLVWLRRRSDLYDEVQRENSRLKQELREVRRAPKKPSKEELAKQMAEMECLPFRRCTSAERVVLKKKLLLKWHPDKQPSPDHSVLATQVMQEMQNLPEWEW